MPRHIDRAMLLTFAEEVRGYLPKIRAGVERFSADPTQHGAFAEAHRYVHTIKGAAAMLGLAVLSHLAYHVEDLLDEIVSADSRLDAPTATWIGTTLTHLEAYLHALLAGQADERAVVSTVVQSFRRLKHLPEDGDAAAIQSIVATQSTEPPATPPTEPAVLHPTTPEPPLSQSVESSLDIPAELIEGFLLEAEDYLNVLGRELPELADEASRRERLQRVRRSVHTLKGAAGIVGFRNIAQLAHRMEDLLDALYEERLPLTPAAQTLLLHTFDTLDEFLHKKSTAEGFTATTQTLERSYGALLVDTSEPVVAASPLPHSGVPLAPLGGHQTTSVPSRPAALRLPSSAETLRPRNRQSNAMVRVPLARVDALVSLLGELVISRSTYEQHLGHLSRQVDELRLSLERLRHVVERVETPLNLLASDGENRLPEALRPGHNTIALLPATPREAEFDALELDRYSEFAMVSRELAENTADLETLGQDFRDILGDFESYVARQGRLTSEIQDKLMRLRMIPLATLSTRLLRTVRVTAEQQGKRATLFIEGEEVEFDKTVLEDIADALLHLLRNAVDHGIEPPELRRVLGKPADGQIRLRAFTEGTQVVVQISDDGAGLEPQLLRAAAVRGGFVSAAEAPQFSHEQLWSLIFTPGFSTTRQVNEISGRGVGMDVVAATVSRLQGRVTLASTPGHGVTFTMRLPMTLARTRVLLVRSSGETFALPFADVLQIIRLEPDNLEQHDNIPRLRLDDQLLPLLQLGVQRHLSVLAEDATERPPVVILQAGDQRVACVVEQLLGGREVVVKTLGSHLHRVEGILGATLMGDGSVVLILNPLELLREDRPLIVPQRAIPSTPAGVAGSLDIMVVDDSFSVRRVVANLLKSAGWQPVLAKDGLEALEAIQRAKRLPDVIVLDVEMPQMDGYEFTSTLRAHARYRHIPIVMLTSRSGSKHRDKAFAVGATEYLVKPYQDETLLNTIRRLASQGEMRQHE